MCSLYPCDENRGKIDDFIAIFEPINCALYRDKIDQFVDFFADFCNKIAIYRDFFLITQDEHYDSRKRSYTTSYTIVYGRIHTKIRSHTIVFRRITCRQDYDRISSCRIRRVYNYRKRSYTVVYSVVCRRISLNFSYLPLSSLSK